MENHKQILCTLCRVCGIKLNKAGSRSKKVADYWEQLNVSRDEDSSVTPSSFCNLCYIKCVVQKQQISCKDWPPHKRIGCNICEDKLRKGGRPKKKKRGCGNAECQRKMAHTSSVTKHFEPINTTLTTIPDSYNIIGSLRPFMCCICNVLCECPVELPCHHVACKACVNTCFVDVEFMICPTCLTNVHYLSVTAVPDLFIQCYMSVAVKCKKCQCQFECRQCNTHVCVLKEHTYAKQPSTSPVQANVEVLGHQLLSAKTAENGIATFRSKGQTVRYMKIPAVRVSSNTASKKTKDRRTHQIQQFRKLISGEDAELEQHRHEFSQLNEELKTMLQTPIRMPQGDILSMRTHLGLSGSRTRLLKRWLAKYRVVCECEASIGCQVDEIIGDNLTSEYVPLLVKDTKTDELLLTDVPLVVVKNLRVKVTQLLDELQSLDMLTWHNGLIPENKIWIKLGGDKGGGTYKFMLQIGNVDRPNSLKNTVTILIWEAGDCTYNLKTGMERIRNQVEDLKTLVWNGEEIELFAFSYSTINTNVVFMDCLKQSGKYVFFMFHNSVHNIYLFLYFSGKEIELFAFGDYEYECRVYGLSGASGRHFCLYCLSSKGKVDLTKRSLESMKKDLESFASNGSMLKNAKFHNNVISSPILDIDIDHVCPPGLHISLGLGLKHYQSLEDACHTLDKKMAQQADGINASIARKEYIKLVEHNECLRYHLNEKENLEQEIGQMTDYFNAFNLLGHGNDDCAIELITQINQKREKLNAHNEHIEATPPSPTFLKRTGPICEELDKRLIKMGITRQAYWGQCFVGNHIHKLYMTTNIKYLMDGITHTVQAICPTLLKEAEDVAVAYTKLFNAFGACHRLYNSAEQFGNAEIDQLQQNISIYKEIFATFHETQPPKFHILCEHIIPWIKKWGVGLGFHGEQGGESMHARLNGIQRDYRGRTTDRLTILLSVVKNHWVSCSPSTLKAIPEKKANKRKIEE
ncbi:uncharacterized protein [Antedon mediterranea]|uniref:uncharacterized protein n=1 Tax=Antedon mediterranea TaxID=105859 RepID=UPI003AF62B1F